jgi:hypothetical protein
MEHSNECIAWWLDQRFDGGAGEIDLDTGSGATPLWLALDFSGGGAAETTKLLVDRGAGLETCPCGVTYLNAAVFGWDVEAFEMILSLGGQQSIDTMHIPQKPASAFIRRVWRLFRFLYYAGDQRWWVYIMATSKGNVTLHAAAMHSLAMTKSVLRHRPDLHAKTSIGQTPLRVAQKPEHESSTELPLGAPRAQKGGQGSGWRGLAVGTAARPRFVRSREKIRW